MCVVCSAAPAGAWVWHLFGCLVERPRLGGRTYAQNQPWAGPRVLRRLVVTSGHFTCWQPSLCRLGGIVHAVGTAQAVPD